MDFKRASNRTRHRIRFVCARLWKMEVNEITTVQPKRNSQQPDRERGRALKKLGIENITEILLWNHRINMFILKNPTKCVWVAFRNEICAAAGCHWLWLWMLHHKRTQKATNCCCYCWTLVSEKECTFCYQSEARLVASNQLKTLSLHNLVDRHAMGTTFHAM